MKSLNSFNENKLKIYIYKMPLKLLKDVFLFTIRNILNLILSSISCSISGQYHAYQHDMIESTRFKCILL